MTVPKKFLFIVGTSFSGSTMIGSSISAASLSFLSEVDRFVPFKQHHDSYMLNSCTMCSAQAIAESCPVFGLERVGAAVSHQGLVEKYLEVTSPCGDVVVDSSKTPDWVLKLHDGGLGKAGEIYAVIAVRNPIAFAYSESDASKVPYWQAAIGWRETYSHALRVLLHRRIPFVIVQYENMFRSSAQIAEKLSTLLGQGIQFAPDSAHRAPLQHCLGGNLGAYLQRPDAGADRLINAPGFDQSESWKIAYYNNRPTGESTRWVQIGRPAAMEILSIPGVADLTSLLGYSLEDLLTYFDGPICPAGSK